ncbi:MAG: hypothetical protein FWD44_05050 [Oscillospiraceae bacterium]|nr:hypothetical protein [Oscillospiraceae bacterium]
MRVRTLIATSDTAYTEHVSQHISEYHSDTIEISVCNTLEHLQKSLSARRYDVALMDAALIKGADLDAVTLPMLLWSEQEPCDISIVPGRTIKHQRISKTVSDVLEKYATVTGKINIAGDKKGKITAVWSPAGGVGKTTLALALAAAAAINEKEAFYLNLEAFSSTPAYFIEQSRSISAVFEMLEAGDGNAKMLIQGICGSESGIKYLCSPDNFDDMCILSPDNIHELVTNCADITEELIVDLSSICDKCTRQVFELADRVLIVTDNTDTAHHKIMQFVAQSNVYESIKDKIILALNKGALPSMEISQKKVSLPQINSTDTKYIYKVLAQQMVLERL